jgi:hypothetical protein
MILLDIDKEQVCLMYRSTRVYDYNTTIDWFILIARFLSSTSTHRDESSVNADRSWEEVQGASWMNGQKREGYLPNTLVQHRTMFVYPLMSLLPPTPSWVL